MVVATTDGEVGTREIRQRREVIHKPSCIDKYNQNMNGCDRADQQIQYYGLHKRKSYKWWKKIFHFLIETAIVNASIIFHLKSGNNRKKMPLSDFKDMLIRQLLEASAESNQRTREVPAPVALVERLVPETHFMETVKKDRNCRVCSKPGKRKRTTNVCSSCLEKPHMCKNNCFKIWHTKQALV